MPFGPFFLPLCILLQVLECPLLAERCRTISFSAKVEMRIYSFIYKEKRTKMSKNVASDFLRAKLKENVKRPLRIPNIPNNKMPLLQL